jgi:endonuclease/exonuclease/phosphatase family metal-dependent hydrolase
MLKKFLKGCFVLLVCLIAGFGLFLLYAIQPGISEQAWPHSAVIQFAIPNSTPNPAPQSLRIVTYNIGYGSGKKNNLGAILSREEVLANLDSMVERLKTPRPDLLFLQEVDFHAHRTFDTNEFRYLAEKLEMPYGAYVVTWNKRYVAWPYWPFSGHFGRMVSGQAVLSRYPILSQQLIEFPKPSGNPFWYNWFYLDRIVQHLTLKIGEREASVYNLHLEAFSVETRREQLEKVGQLAKADPTELKLVAGDFNLADPIKSGIVDDDADRTGLLRDFAKNTGFQSEGPQAPFYSFSSWDPVKRIDHVFFAPSFVLQNAGNLEGLLASDHLPVWVELNMAQPSN